MNDLRYRPHTAPLLRPLTLMAIVTAACGHPPARGDTPATRASGRDNLAFSTRIGGSAWDRVQAVAVDDDGFIYLCGTTKSDDFPVTPGAFDTTASPGSDNDGWVGKLSPDGRRLIWATYLHGNARDDVYGILVDKEGFIYAVGWTASSNFPLTPGAYDRTFNGDRDIFVTKLKPDGSGLVFSTLVGGSKEDQSRGGLDVDPSGVIYASGYSQSPDFPTTPGAFQRANRLGDSDAVLFKLSADGSRLLASTFLGSSGRDHAFLGAHVHADGSVYLAGASGAGDLPVTDDAFQTRFGGTSGPGHWQGDQFVARFKNDLSGLIFCTYLGGSGRDTSSQNGLHVDKDGNACISGSTTSPNFPTTPGAFQPKRKGEKDLFVTIVSADGGTLIASTYLGGEEDAGNPYIQPSGLRRDAAGYVHLGGTNGEPDFPVTPNAVQPAMGGKHDAFYVVLSPDLRKRVYGTFFGGPGGDRCRDLWLDPSGGSAVLCGDTRSAPFPTTPGVVQRKPQGGGDAYAVKIDFTRRFRRGEEESNDQAEAGTGSPSAPGCGNGSRIAAGAIMISLILIGVGWMRRSHRDPRSSSS